MTRRHWLLAFLLLAIAVPGGSAQEAPTLRLMTFNIRYGTADDGDHVWPNRRHLVEDIIARENPDVIAIQEALDFQLEELEGSALQGYRKLGQHRDGGTGGEFSGLYVKTSLQLLDWGEFWLSETPDVVASRGWDAALHRMAVWAEIAFGDAGDVIRIYGTHFDHRGEHARVESAKLIAEHATDAGLRAVVMGDLNVPDDSEAIRTFAELRYRSAVTTLHPRIELGTFNGFRDPDGGGRRIDHILVGPDIQLLDARILDDRVDGLFPSDHFPVVAIIRPG